MLSQIWIVECKLELRRSNKRRSCLHTLRPGRLANQGHGREAKLLMTLSKWRPLQRKGNTTPRNYSPSIPQAHAKSCTLHIRDHFWTGRCRSGCSQEIPGICFVVFFVLRPKAWPSRQAAKPPHIRAPSGLGGTREAFTIMSNNKYKYISISISLKAGLDKNT